MISKLRNIFLLAAFVLAGFSCAETLTVDSNEIELTSFDKWMAKYYPEYPQIEEGLYYKIIKGNNENGETPDSTSDWVYVKYTGQDLEGNYFANTYKPLSKHLGTYGNRTHFVPLISNYSYSSTIITTGALYALSEMQEGDSVDVFMSSVWIGSATSAPYTGFGGNLYSVGSQPIRYSMKFESMTSNPSKLSNELAERYAIDSLGLTLADSISTGLYYKIINAMPDADTVPADSNIYLKYTGMFLDGFVFDTNDQDVDEALELNLSTDDYSSPYTLLSYAYSNVYENDTEYVDGFAAVVKKMRIGETAICVFSSDYGYGTSGSTEGSTIIQPYDPLVFKIEIITEEDMEDYDY